MASSPSYGSGSGSGSGSVSGTVVSSSSPHFHSGLNFVQGHFQHHHVFVEHFLTRLKRKATRRNGAGPLAVQTAELLRIVVAKTRFQQIRECFEVIRRIGKQITQARPVELSIGNIVRRVLAIVHTEITSMSGTWTTQMQQTHKNEKKKKTEEKKRKANKQTNSPLQTTPNAPDSPDYNKDIIKEQQQNGTEATMSLLKMLDNDRDSEEDMFMQQQMPANWFNKIKPIILEEIGLLIDEIMSAKDQIAEQAIEHIHSNDVILTYNMSKTVLAFLQEAAKLRKFEVFVAESAPDFSGQRMASALANAGIETTVIADSAVFALIPAINKVIVGTHAVMANGGIVAQSGAHNLAVAAKLYNVPFVVLTGLHKLCPLYAFDQDTFNEQGAPSEVLKFDEIFSVKQNCQLDLDSDMRSFDVRVANPLYDFVPPELVTLFITNIGGHNPSYIYRLLAEYYNPSDYKL